MIVCSCFAEDDLHVAWQQHEVYGKALSVIASECQRRARVAATILDIEPPKAAAIEDGFDHRTLQTGHDIIAAAWRFRMNVSQARLSFDGSEPLGMRGWLNWLHAEISSWEHEPILVRHVIKILEHQNTDVGYRAERRLHRGLLRRYDDVPWPKERAALGQRMIDESD